MNTQKPKQYSQGYTEFYKLKFKLTPDVLIPRPETELLVDLVLSFCHSDPELVEGEESLANATSDVANASKLKQVQRSLDLARDDISIIDVGTGSGCIAISIAKNLPKAKVIALDISPKALEIAKLNAKFHKVENKIFFLESDLISRLHLEGVKPDIIVTNLPYIPTTKLLLIDPMVTEFEPRIALDGGVDGFELYRKLFTQIEQKNIYPKYLICEIDELQAQTALSESKKYFPKAKAEIKKDLTGANRILLINF